MGRAKEERGNPWARRGLWLLLLGLAGAGAIRASGSAQGETEEVEAPLPETPLPPLGPSPGEGGAEDPDALPGRDDPEEFYRPPPRPQKRITKIPA